MTHPTACLLTPSFESWDREDRWRPKIRQLQRRGWIKSAPASACFPYLVTRAGRERALGIVDPENLWNRPWDGTWMEFSFDLPVTKRACRARLLRWLHAQRFGRLQHSVWIRPDMPNPPFPLVHDLPCAVDGLVVLEARCHRGFSNAQIVNAAWEFNVINDHYQIYLDLLESELRGRMLPELDPDHAIALLRREHSLWNKATRLDPMLPRCLWPIDYLGPVAWGTRRQLLRL